MKHLSLILLFIGSFLRVPSYWITIDGNFDRNVALDPFGAFTYYFYYPCVISAYTCEIFIWSELLISNVVYAPIQVIQGISSLFDSLTATSETSEPVSCSQHPCLCRRVVC